jgi:hypothetical protein
METTQNEQTLKSEAEGIKRERTSPWLNIDKRALIFFVIGIILIIYMYQTKRLTGGQVFAILAALLIIWYLMGRKETKVGGFITAKMAILMMRDYCNWQRLRGDSGCSLNDRFIVNMQTNLNELERSPTKYYLNITKISPDERRTFYRGIVDCYIGNPQLVKLGIETLGTETEHIKKIFPENLLEMERHPGIMRWLK